MDIITLADAVTETAVNLKPIASGLAVLAAGLGIGCIGMKAAESTGRNPGASGQVLTISIILAALVEGVAFVAIFMG